MKISLLSWHSLLKLTVFLLSLLPIILLLINLLHDDLGPNPIETLIRETGLWGLRFLLLTLAITPLRKITGWHFLLKLRRMLGLYSFFYATIHVIIYLWLEQFFDLGEILADILERPFITVGFFSFILLLPLAITSNNKMIKYLGGKRWQYLHRLVYPITIGVVIHFWWMAQSKVDVSTPFFYAIMLAILLLFRLFNHWFGKYKKQI